MLIVLGAVIFALVGLYVYVRIKHKRFLAEVAVLEAKRLDIERYKRLAYHINVYPEEDETDEEFVTRFKSRYLHTNEEMP